MYFACYHMVQATTVSLACVFEYLKSLVFVLKHL